MKKIVSLLLAGMMLLAACTAMAAGRLETIAKRGTLRVGSTGDYRPMSYLNQETGKYEGLDADLAENLAAALGVKVEYVPTTWKTLTADTMADKFDVAICGISRTYAREKVMDLSDGYLVIGKTFLCRKEDAGKFRKLEDVNKAGVRVMHNPGGTNEKFANAHLTKATLIVHPQNAEIPGLVAEGKADIMVTETVEAARYVKLNNKLAAPMMGNPLEKKTFGLLMPKGDQAFLNFVNFWLDDIKVNGTLEELKAKNL